jgi:hypothetical protein
MGRLKRAKASSHARQQASQCACQCAVAPESARSRTGLATAKSFEDSDNDGGSKVVIAVVSVLV